MEKNPCAVVLEDETPPFDVKAYRADLQRRVASLTSMERAYHRAYMMDQHDMRSFHAANRCADKARGLEIALSLLPPPAEAPAPVRSGWYRPGSVLR